MFSVSKQLLRSSYVTLGIRRGFASSCVYVSNLPGDTTAEILRDKFQEFGQIAGIRMNTGTKDYKYAHVYFMSGTPPMINGQLQPMVQMNPTEEENMAVMEAITKAVETLDSSELNGNIIHVKPNDPRPPRPNRNRQQNNEAVSAAMDKGYKAGFAEGYSRGYSDAIKEKL
ncbi:hypothetical protein LPJ56_004170 [Coemansia sp. RSA 2599]|nr:hypothetical protein LPJ75_004023 [Coemansia sp. RSA 2598]KAJ1816969.1 hypothetical protein LPJ56_004170 [Coemansia sp. RSA 2599]